MFVKEFDVGDLVWAKMKSFPPWPGKIVDPPANAKPRKGFHYVFFLGSENHAWMKDETINHHAEHLIPPSSKKKAALLQNAIDEIIELSKGRPYKVDKYVENTDGAFSGNSSKAKLPRDEKSKDSKKSPKGKKRLSSNKFSPDKPLKVRKLGECSSITKPRKLTVISKYDSSSDNDIEAEVLSDDSDFIEMRGHVEPTSKKIGFLGLGNMGKGIAKNLLYSGHEVTVWNRTPGKCLDLIQAGAISSENPAEVVKASDIVFCCVSDAAAVKSLVFGHNGVLKGLEDNGRADGKEVYKGYVEMTSIDSETSIEISEAIRIKGCKYLEASLVGSKACAEQGDVLVLASGSRELFDACETCFHAISSVSYYLTSDVGLGSKYGLIISAMMGTTFAAIAEALALAERIKVSKYDFLKILELKGLTCPEVINRAKLVIRNKFNELNTALRLQQKDMDLTLAMSNNFPQPMPVTTAANELYKHAKLLGYGDHDITAVFYGAKY